MIENVYNISEIKLHRLVSCPSKFILIGGFYMAQPDPDDIYYDDDSGMYVDSETGDMYYDAEGEDPF